MAILDKFEATIVVNGEQAREFEDDGAEGALAGENGPQVSKYVEVVSGARFEFKIDVSPRWQIQPNEGLLLSFWLDGRKLGGMFYTQKSHSQTRGGTTWYRLAWVSDEWVRFSFAQLETRETNSEDVAKLPSSYKDLGTMKVEISRVELLDFSTESSKRNLNYELASVPEKALKGRSLDVAGKLIRDNTLSTCKVRDSRRIGDPLATFHFKYRTKKGLQSLLLLPRSESPEPVEDRPYGELSREELEERLKRQEEQLALVKQEGHKRQRSETTSEPVRTLKSSRTNGGKVIYHLDSSDDDDNAMNKNEPPGAPRKEEEIETVDLL